MAVKTGEFVPLFPNLPTDSEPTDADVIGHNLAVIAETLQAIKAQLEGRL
jgi:hypothetical protein